jgi:uncharacterized membrane protein
MSGLEALSGHSRAVLYTLVAIMGLLTVIVTWAQVGCIRGRPFRNPDGTADDWREQKVFYGIAWADLTVACPLSFAGIAMLVIDPGVGLLMLTGVGVWMAWANVMTTVTSLRFEKPRITAEWLLVFPFGGLVGLAYVIWILIHFDNVYG